MQHHKLNYPNKYPLKIEHSNKIAIIKNILL